MNNKSIDEVLFKYFLHSTSYIRTMLDILPDEVASSKEKTIILEIFNNIFKNLTRNELNEVAIVSNMYEAQIASESYEDALIQAKYLHKVFLRRMEFESFNRKLYFDKMNESIKIAAGYYQKGDDSNFYENNVNAIGNIHVR